MLWLFSFVFSLSEFSFLKDICWLPDFCNWDIARPLSMNSNLSLPFLSVLYHYSLWACVPWHKCCLGYDLGVLQLESAQCLFYTSLGLNCILCALLTTPTTLSLTACQGLSPYRQESLSGIYTIFLLSIEYLVTPLPVSFINQGLGRHIKDFVYSITLWHPASTQPAWRPFMITSFCTFTGPPHLLDLWTTCSYA